MRDGNSGSHPAEFIPRAKINNIIGETVLDTLRANKPANPEDITPLTRKGAEALRTVVGDPEAVTPLRQVDSRETDKLARLKALALESFGEDKDDRSQVA